MKRYYCQACHKMFKSDTDECPVCESSDFTKLQEDNYNLDTEDKTVKMLIGECEKFKAENKRLKSENERLRAMMITEEEYD